VKFYGDIDLSYNTLKNAVVETVSGFPPIPLPGQIIFKNKVLYICAEITGGLPVWIPMSGEIDSFIYAQSTPAITWTIAHNLHSSTVFVQIYDTSNRMIIPEDVDTSQLNVTVVTFATAQSGRAVVMLGSLSGMPKELVAWSGTFTDSTTWVVNHGLGYNPLVKVYIGNYEVQPFSIVHNSTTISTVTFSSPQSGQVRCV